MVDVIMCAIFGDCRLKGVGVVRGVSLPSPTDFTRRPYNTGHKVIESGTIWKLGYGFLFAFRSNYDRIFSHFGDIQLQRMARPWNLGLGLFKVIANGAVQ